MMHFSSKTSGVIRRKCPKEISSLIEKAQQSQFFILQELGPMAFMLRDNLSASSDETLLDENNAASSVDSNSTHKKFKVALGSTQSCTCPRYLIENDLCIHIVKNCLCVP